MTTAATLIAETQRLIHAGSHEQANKLAAAITDTTGTSVSLTYALGGLSEGTVICVDLELMYVWATDTTALTATVQRGYMGSTAATHSNGAFVQVNPRYSRFAIFTAINQDLDDLVSQGLYSVATVELTYSAAVQGYDLTGVTNLYKIIEVKFDEPGSERSWPVVPPNRYRLERGHDTGDFASGMALQLYDPLYPGRAVRVTYRKPFTHFSAESDDAQSVAGLAASMNDLPPMGATMRLTLPKEIKRNFTESQGDTRRPDEVPVQAIANSARALATLRQGRIEAEKMTLARQWPDYIRV